MAKKMAVLSSIGPDRPGIVAALCDIFSRFNCNIEDSTMTRLGQEFAIIVIISMPETLSLEDLSLACNQIEEQFDLKIILRDISQEQTQSHNWKSATPYLLSVTGHDRTGITFNVTQCLANHGANITDLNAQVIEGEDGQVYLMMIEMDVLPETSIARLEQELQALARELCVEIQMRPIEALTL